MGGVQTLSDLGAGERIRTRTILRNLGYVRPEKQSVGISAVPPRQSPAESGVAGIGRLLPITPGAPPE